MNYAQNTTKNLKIFQILNTMKNNIKDYEKINELHLLEAIKTYDNLNFLFDDLKNVSKNESRNLGDIFEKLWDIIFKFGLVNDFNNSKITHFYGNLDTNNLKQINDLHTYMIDNLVLSKNAGGKSDITFFDNSSNKWIFISSKFRNNEIDIEKYDISDIAFYIPKNIENNYEIVLLVNNKDDFNKKCINAHQGKKKIVEKIFKIYDFNDLKYYYSVLHQLMKNKTIDKNTINDFIKKKDILIPRFHQQITVYNMIKLINEGYKDFLFGWKCRSGKTYGAGYLIQEYLLAFKSCNVLIILPTPNETSPQFHEDVFVKFKNFDEFNILKINSSSQLLTNLDFIDKNIIIISKQMLDYSIRNEQKTFLDKININLIIFDENHFSGTSNKTEFILNKYSNKNTIRLYLTATYSKTLNKWPIEDNCQFYWNIEDEINAKNRNISYFVDKFGYDTSFFLNNENKEYILKSYDSMPEMMIIQTSFDDEIYHDIKEEIKDTSYGFSYETLFSLNKKQDKFNYGNEIVLLLNKITGTIPNKKYIIDKKGIYNRIKNLSLKYSSRTFIDDNFCTQLWFLPFGINNNINNVSICLKELITNHYGFKDFDVMIINSHQNIKNLKNEIKNYEINAQANHKKGLILLAGTQCHLGITLPLCDIVFLLNNNQSSSRIIQMMYRCMSESTDNSKKIGYVVDFNINRILNTLIDFSEKEFNSIEDNIKYLIENNLIKIDDDIFDNNEKSNELIEQLMNKWISNSKDITNNLLNKLKHSDFDLDEDDQHLLNKSYYLLEQSNKNIVLNLTDQDIQSGREIHKINENNNDNFNEEILDKNNEEENNILNNISFQSDILPLIIPLISFISIDFKNNNIFDILNIIENNDFLLKIFKNMMMVWWDNDNFKFIKKLCFKYLKDKHYINYIVISMKLTMNNLIDKPEECLNYINSCLKPKKEEKKKHGEVFTPMDTVNKLLDNLDEEYIKKYDRSIFKEKEFKWYDPANGMGNFPIGIYYRLMIGLKDIIVNENERKKHILENMLYMSEIQEKNFFLCDKIFNSSKSYKLNHYCGDSLLIDEKELFGIDKFDVIIGNPPYNDSSGNKGKNHTLWTKFVEKYTKDSILNKNGFLCFFHPPLWRKLNNKLFDIFKSKNLLYLEIHNVKDGNKVFSGCSTRFDCYILQNCDYQKNTIILDEDNQSNNIDLSEWKFIPNKLFKLIKNLLSKDKNVLDINYYRSNYGHDKKWVSKIKDREFIYPVIYSIDKNNSLSLRYSNTNQNGHFNKCKFIFSNGSGYYLDTNGDYGLTQWAYCIYDNPDNLKLVQKAFESDLFKNLIDALKIDSSKFNIDTMKLFKKDFYTEFI